MQTVIVGAGVLGASTAFHLARAGVPVVVVDAALDGRATAAGAGIICPWVSSVPDTAFYRLYAGGGDYYADLIEQLEALGETAVGYRRCGALLVSADARELDWLERTALQRRINAPLMGQVSRVAAGQAQALFPPLRPDFGGVLVSGGARVDGRLLAAALLRAAGRLGAAVLHGHARVVLEGGRVAGVDIGGADGIASARETERQATERIAADQVVIATGAWAKPSLAGVGVRLPVEPQRGQIVHLDMAGASTEDWPVILPPGSHYLVPFDGGRIVVGATRETDAGFDYRVTAAGQAEVLHQALGVAPGRGAARVVETRVGFRPVAADNRPLLGRVRGVDGVVVGNGLGAAGLTIGPFAGRLLADLVLRRPALLDLAPFDPSRCFSHGAVLADALR